jgi:hypothetical protein
MKPGLIVLKTEVRTYTSGTANKFEMFSKRQSKVPIFLEMENLWTKASAERIRSFTNPKTYQPVRVSAVIC